MIFIGHQACAAPSVYLIHGFRSSLRLELEWQPQQQ
jgi:hypothetical protein